MSKIGFPIILFLIVSKVYSQQGYFVLIQADNDQPFYVRLESKTLGSSPKGHLIIPQLKDSTYNFIIGFPKIAIPEAKFSIGINKTDRDLQLRNLGERGWALYNRQTQEWILPLKVAGDSNKVHLDGIRKEDAFSQLMAGVVNDTSVMYITFKSGAQAKDTIEVKQFPVKMDSPAAKEEKMALIAPPKPDPPPQDRKINKAGIKETGKINASVFKIKQRVLNTAFQLIYLDKSKAGEVDTIIIFIPFETQLISKAALDSSGNFPAGIVKKSDTSLAKVQYPIAAEPVPVQPAEKIKTTRGIVPPRADCKNFASENDVDRLRVKILGEKKLDDKIAQARKTFKSKCFSSKQIKTLSELFPDDESKYTFFDAAYPFVSDTENFKQLAQFLNQEYYLNRFKALIGQ